MKTLIDEAADLLNAESLRLFNEPLYEEQREALYDEDQAFAMIDDMEVRMGFDVSAARVLLERHYVGEEY